MGITITEATPDELAIVRALEKQLIAFERRLDPAIKRGDDVYYYDLKKMIDTDQAVVLLAWDSDKPVGCGLAEIRDNPNFAVEPRYGYIGMMYVIESYRGQKVGQQLMNGLIEWLKRQGLNDIRLKTYSDNNDAIKAYKTYGFDPYVLEMKLL